MHECFFLFKGISCYKASLYIYILFLRKYSYSSLYKLYIIQKNLGGWLNCIKMNIASVHTFCFGRVLLGSWKHVMSVLKSFNLFQSVTKLESKPVKRADFVDIWYHKNYFLLDTLVLSQMLLEINELQFWPVAPCSTTGWCLLLCCMSLPKGKECYICQRYMEDMTPSF